MSTEKISLEFQERDLALFRDLFESRVMTGAHIAVLHFDGSEDAAKKRLQKLKASGFISERPRRPTEPALLSLAPKAFGILRERGILHDYPALTPTKLRKRAIVRGSTLSHELEVMDVKAAFHVATRKAANISVAEFSTWPLLHRFDIIRNGATVPVEPDGFIRFHEKETDGGLSEHTFFLEVDRNSESLGTLVAKAANYLDYYKSGGFAVRNGAGRNAYKEFPFRVLIVVPRAKRRNDLAHLLLYNKPPIFTQVYLSTTDEVTADPFGPVWVTPRTYRETLTGTLFDTEKFPPTRTYRKETERDSLIEVSVKKVPLLA